MAKLDSLIREMSALENTLEKNASKSSSRLASFLDKIAEEAECEDSECDESDKEKEKEQEEENNKEGSMRNYTATKIARAIKSAVLDNEQTQGSTVQVGPKSGDGAATNAAREQDQIISGDKVESEAESNPQRHNTSTSSDLIEDEPVNEKDMAEALKEGRLLLYTDKEAALLTKFASVGYNYIVDTYSDQIVQEKIAEQIMAQKAAQAPQKIASAILQREAAQKVAAQQLSNQQANDNKLVQKLAAVKKNDPTLFNALRVMADRGLI